MIYIELVITIDPDKIQDYEIIIARLAELPYESFAEESPVIKAYIPKEKFSIKEVNEILEDFIAEKYILTISHIEIMDENWNIKWEQNFPPIVICDQCIVRAPFHKIEKVYDFEIIIEPKMSFGTGHHETTSLMIEQILKTELKNKVVLDMGCGTGILAILASKTGAKAITAIDHDSWAYENTLENIVRNNTSNIEAFHGDAKLIEGTKFDVILANINRNIILQDMPVYSASLNKNGEMLLSGFYLHDKDMIEDRAKAFGLTAKLFREKNNWIVLNLVKSS
ncbi:MAG: 50S ribosomal protein L11 methyltransferase [Bacteroidales bacterium]|nr:50S ribosomal protein L11 methyltransferase [Bacteroidales bacterium]